jgi:hypothetical protein
MNNGPQNYEFKTMLNDLSPIDQADALGLIATRRFRKRIIAATHLARTQPRGFIEQIVHGAYRTVEGNSAVVIADTIDRFVERAGHDPRSVDGRLYRQRVATRLTFSAMAINVVCAIISPSALPILAIYAVIWPWFLWRSAVERKALTA